MPRLSHQIITLKGTNKCYVSLGQKKVYIGQADDPHLQLAFHQAVLDYLTERMTAGPTVAVFFANYLKWAEQYYRGNPLWVVRSAIKYANAYLERPVERFGPLDLERIRENMIKKGLARKTCNDMTNKLARIWKWGAAKQMVPVTVYQSLKAVEPLRAGRSNAKERQKVKPVPMEHIVAIQPYVTPQVWAMVQVQLLTGARPGEVVMLQARDIVQQGRVWTAQITDHKNTWRGQLRTLYFGPKAQEILRPWLLRHPDACLFNPRECTRFRVRHARTRRRPGQPETPRKTARILGDHYTVDSYRRAIARACKLAKVPAWHPHQLRHTAATRVRQEYGLEAAQVVLGHACADVTQIYAERDSALARAVAEKMG